MVKPRASVPASPGEHPSPLLDPPRRTWDNERYGGVPPWRQSDQRRPTNAPAEHPPPPNLPARAAVRGPIRFPAPDGTPLASTAGVASPPPESEDRMSTRRLGLWLIGACGGVGTTATLGLAALKRGVTDTTSLVTALPLFDGVDLDPFDRFVVGGHEVRRGGFRQTVKELQQRSNIFDPALADACAVDLEEWEANLRPGTTLNAGPTIAKLADLPEATRSETPRAAI